MLNACFLYSGEISEAIIIERQENNVKIRYIVESTTMMEEVPEALVNTINTYDVLKYDMFVVTKDAVEKIEEVYA